MGGGRTALRGLVLAACGLLGLALPAAGQGRLNISLTTTAIVFPTPGILDFDTGWIDHGGYLVTIQSRPATHAWELRIRADLPTMGGYGKPVSDILWRTSTSTVWAPLTETSQVVAQGQGDTDITVLFRMRLAWAIDRPDAYTVGITFDAVRP